MNKLALISNPTLQQEIARAAIQKMLNNSFFSYIEIQDAAKVAGKDIHPETMQMLRTIHCVDFAMMSEQVKSFIFEVCNAVCA